MESTVAKIKKDIKKFDKLSIVLILISVITIAISPYLFTRSLTNINFSETGDIGSTIGGITAPFIGILSAILVFLSFRAQIKANLYQLEAIETEREIRRLENISTFLYHRLEEIKNTGTNPQFVKALEKVENLITKATMLGDEIINKRGTGFASLNEGEIKERINIKEKKRNSEILIISRYINLIIISLDKLSEVKGKLDDSQYNYLDSSLRFEENNVLEYFSKTLMPKINTIIECELIDKDAALINLYNLMDKLKNK